MIHVLVDSSCAQRAPTARLIALFDVHCHIWLSPGPVSRAEKRRRRLIPMTVTFRGHPPLQALGLHQVAFFSFVTLLRAGRQSAEDIFHAGHEAVHVTRLHRYEHEGLSSLIEAEARWKSEAASPAILLRSRALHPKRQAFVRVSKVQEAALKAHQSAFMEAARGLEDAQSSGKAEVRNDGRLVQDGKLIRYHGVEVPNENHPAETRLTSLESQYIGQIGVGSVLFPQGCQPSGESLIYLGPAEYLNATEEQRRRHKNE
eukprot:s531_g19.t1